MSRRSAGTGHARRDGREARKPPASSGGGSDPNAVQVDGVDVTVDSVVVVVT